MLGPTYATPLAVDLAPGSTAVAYVAGKTIGSLMTIPTPGPIRSGDNGPIAIVETLVVSDAEKKDGDLDLVLFDEIPADPGNNVTYAPSAADLAKVSGVIRVRAADYSDFSANSVADVSAIVKTTRLKEAKQFYALFVARGAITFASPGSLKGKLSGLVS